MLTNLLSLKFESAKVCVCMCVGARETDEFHLNMME